MLALACAAATNLWADDPVAQDRADSYDRAQVGDRVDGRIVVPTNQVLAPLGQQVAFPGRPTDIALHPGGRFLAVLNRNELLVLDAQNGQIVDAVEHKSGSYQGLLFHHDGATLFASNILGSIGVFRIDEQGQITADGAIELPPRDQGKRGNALPVGLALSDDGRKLYVALNLHNTLGEIDVEARKLVREIDVGNAPYDVVLVGQRAYVSNWAGRIPGPGDVQGPSGRGPNVRVDATRHIASDCSVSVVDLATGLETRQIVVGLHPNAIVASSDGQRVYVANAHSDAVSVIDTAHDEVTATISVRPAEKLLFGSSPVDLLLAPDDQTLYVANATNNAIAVLGLQGAPRLLGCFPTGWYPAALALDAPRGMLFVANVKGIGSRDSSWLGDRKLKDRVVFGYNSHDYLGTVSLIPRPTLDELARHTAAVLEMNRQTEAESALAPPRAETPPRPVPLRHGEPSVFKHVLYIIKENRTYDQVLGDVERGDGDASLCIFGREVTPNHHKLVDEFVLLDNFYCSGTLSADGHQWATEAYVSDYIERAYGGWPRSYPYDGGDAMAYAPSGFLWDNALAHQRSIRIYGEFVSAQIRWKDAARTESPSFLHCYRDFLAGGREIEVRATAAIASLEPHICPTAIGFPSIVPDVHRAAQFVAELKEFEAAGKLPNLMVMLLPNDHTAGTRPGMPTPEAAVADNDLALGRVIEAVSKSKFWNETCVFVVQDDPQAGFDHVDGHRTVALVVSPYTRRGAVDSTNYNQTGMIRTMELILGLPPMNQFDASATPMTHCFTDVLDLRPYDAVANNIPLDRVNPELSSIRDARQLHWAQASLAQPLDDVDEADEDTLNRILWHATRGDDQTYPAWAVLPDDDDDAEEHDGTR